MAVRGPKQPIMGVVVAMGGTEAAFGIVSRSSAAAP